LCHRRYGIVCLAVAAQEAASFIRRLLGHRAFDTKGKRMGKVIRLSHDGVRVWTIGEETERRHAWR
jgi:hypothetical protein